MNILNKFKKKTDSEFLQIEVTSLIEWNEPNGEGCIASDKITKDGWNVGYMYREVPTQGQPDSGWRFLKGDEDDEYMNNANNHHVFSLNTICNYDKGIIPYLMMDVGTHLIRLANGKFIADEQTQQIYMIKQKR